MASFQAGAAGTLPLAYQWFHDTTAIEGATNDSLSLSNLQPQDAGRYWVQATNVLGGSTSRVAELTLGPIVGWGLNSSEQARVPSGLTNPVAIAAGTFGSLALMADGGVVEWGEQFAPMPAGLTNIQAIASGGYWYVAAHKDGRVVAWGLEPSGVTNVPSGLTTTLAVAAGQAHGLALLSEGRVVAWGDPVGADNRGQTEVPPDLTNAVSIAAGAYHSLALRQDGTLAAWGNGASIPAGLADVVAVAAGGSHNLALRSDGTIATWGDSSFGLDGPPPGLTDVVAVAAGPNNSAAVKSDGTLVVWGATSSGQTAIPGGLRNSFAASVGSGHLLALTGDGSPWLTVQPFSRTVASGSTLKLAVRATGVAPLRYQWQFRGADIRDATNSVLVLTGVQSADAGEYRCVVTNALGSITSSPAVLTILRPPLVFDTSPSGLQLTNGGIRLTLTGLAQSGPVVLYSSTNLVDWLPVVTNPPSSGTLQFRDPQTWEGSKYYRASEGQ